MHGGIGFQAGDERSKFASFNAHHLPAGLYPGAGGGEIGIDFGNDGVAVQYANVETGRTGTGHVTIYIVIDRRRKNGEVGLMQAAQHFTQHGACFVHRLRALDARKELLMNGGPIEPAGFRVPMLVADGGPDLLERLQVKLTLVVGELREKRGS